METPRLLPGLIDKRLLAESDLLATLMVDGGLILVRPDREVVTLSATAAFDLLVMLYEHRELVYRQSQEPTGSTSSTPARR